MERTMCERENCEETANKFCLNCKVMLCKFHRVDEVKENQANKTPEHYCIDAYDYNMNPDYYQAYYCEFHEQEMLTGRCINCGKFACNECIPEFCPNSAGKNHDYDSISVYVGKYKGELLEFEQLVRKKHETFNVKLKEECSKRKETESYLEQMMNKVDEEVKLRITALIDDGEKLKEEILNKKNDLNKRISEQIMVLEQMELQSRNLLKSIEMCISDASGIKLVKTYSKIKENTEALLQERPHFSQLPAFQLFTEGSELRRPLQLQLKQAVQVTEVLHEEILATKEKIYEIKLLKTHEADDRAYHAVSCIPKDIKQITSENAVITGGQDFTEVVQGGERRDRKHQKSQVQQLVPYGSEILMLTQDSDIDTYRYTITKLDSGDIVYSFADSMPFWNKLIAVTYTRHLLALHVKTQTLHIVSLETGEKIEKRLSDTRIQGANGIMVPSDGKLIIACEGPKGHRLLKYDLESEQVLWEYETLCGSRLNVAQYQDTVLVIKEDNPTDVWSLRLSNGVYHAIHLF